MFGPAMHSKRTHAHVHTCWSSHMHPETHRHTHISAACGWLPQRSKTSCIPHAYVTPFPPPPADHSSFYPAFALSLSPSLLLSLRISPDGALCYPATFLFHSGHQRTHLRREIRLKSENLTHESAQLATTQRVTELLWVKLPLLPVHL